MEEKLVLLHDHPWFIESLQLYNQTIGFVLLIKINKLIQVPKPYAGGDLNPRPLVHNNIHVPIELSSCWHSIL